MQRLSILLCCFLASACASRTPLGTPVPFVVSGRVLTEDGQPVAGAHVKLSEEHSRLFPLVLAPSRELGRAISVSDGSFNITVTTSLQNERLMLFVRGRTYVLRDAELRNKSTERDDSVYTYRVRVPGPNVVRVRRGFIPGPAEVTVEQLPRF